MRSVLFCVFQQFNTSIIVTSFHRAVLNVTALTYMPFWEEKEVQTSKGPSVAKYDGTDYQLLMTTAAALNFTIQVLRSKSWADVSSSWRRAP